MQHKNENNGNNFLGADRGQAQSVDVNVPSVCLSKGGGAIQGIDEKFQVNSANGTSTFAIPLPVSSSRGGFTPLSALTYNSGSGNSPFGLGWQLNTSSISRSTAQSIPQYRDSENSDTFTLTGAEDLVPWLEKDGDNWVHLSPEKDENGITYIVDRYRPRIEGSFLKIERWKRKDTGEVHWRTVTSANIHSLFGFLPESRIADPDDESRIFEWKLCKTHDDKGNIVLYKYKKEDFSNIPDSIFEKNRKKKTTQIYLKAVYYGNKTAWFKGDNNPGEDDFMFRVVLDYGEHDDAENIPADVCDEKNDWECRNDPFSSYRAGFEIRTYRRCKRIMMFHCFSAEELPLNPYLVNSLQLFYENNAHFAGSGKDENGFSFLVKAKQNGHKWDNDAGYFSTKNIPETEFTYQPHEWNTKLENLSSEAVTHFPAGIADKKYLWVDLFSEGIAGILTEQGEGWFYKSNLGNGTFSNAIPVTSSPSLRGLNEGVISVQELAGDGSKYLVQLSDQPKGFYKLDDEDTWERMRTFDSVPNISLANPDTRALDLTGDGVVDLLTSTDSGFIWYPGKGEEGFEASRTVFRELDEEKGPVALFSDPEETIFLADMSGDGLADIVRIRNGEICYWPNLGYARFGAKVNMLNAPLFDYAEKFNPALIRLSDIDGSGITDIVYLGNNEFRIWMNQNGNSWSENYHSISPFPSVHNMASIDVMDFLGKGTACIVYSDPLRAEPLQYIDLMNSKKPHLLIKYINNCGKETTITYTPSTEFYLKDKEAGRKWITKLPFSVQCVSSVRMEDKIRKVVFTSTYSYSHGYYDHTEKEFRGFARTEQLDTETFENFSLNDALNVIEKELSQPPVRTVNWFHAGAFLRGEKILQQYKDEYYSDEDLDEYEIPDAIIKDELTSEEYRQAVRACKGMSIRSEVYADDGTGLSGKPYSVSESNCEIVLVQPVAENGFAVFQVIASENISYTCDRNPSDPRISHNFVLEHDDIGNITKTVSVIYPRRERPVAPDEIPDNVWDEQNKLFITSSEALFTDDDYITDEIYRLRVAYESKSYEVAGIAQPSGFYFNKGDLLTDINAADEILYEADFRGSKEKRLSSHSRIYFMKDDLSGAMNIGELSGLGLIHRSYGLIFTEKLITKLYGTKVTNQMLEDAKYVHLEGDKHWWAPTSTAIYTADPATDFYIPSGVKDIFDKETHTTYDAYRFLPVSVCNSAGYVTIVENDYRTMSPWMITNHNMNRAAVETDELGMVIKSSIMGKEGTGEGDTLDDPTSYMEYDLFNWKNNEKPNYAHGFVREKHGDSSTNWLESYTYSDGCGNVIMGKAITKPGDAIKWDDVQKKIITVHADPRWIGNGRTILNNKGNPVKQYEPYFSTTHEYEYEAALVETGITPVIYYDPVGRVIKTVYPNGTFSKSEFNPWIIYVYDVNDTIKDSDWFADRGSPAVDPGTADPEIRNAWLASLHHNTPGTIHLDFLGKSFYAIADYGGGKTSVVHSESDPMKRHAYSYDQKNRLISESYTNMAGQSLNGKTAEKGERWIFNDAMGRLAKTWDNDLFEIRPSYDVLHRPVSMYITEKGKDEVLFSHIVFGDILPDATDRNMKGFPIMVFDQSGMLRIRTVDFKGNPLETERRLVTDYKNVLDWKALEGLDDILLIEAAAVAKLDTEIFTVSTELDALNRATQTTLPDGTVIQPEFDTSNTLEKIEVQIRGTGSFIPFLQEQQYNAKGQRQYALYGNGLITNYFYEAKTNQLSSVITKKAGADDSESIQNLNYIFDPVGNISYLSDKAQQTHYFKNDVVKPEHFFQYDAMYQLISATGREHAGIGAGQPTGSDFPYITAIPHLNDENAVRNYTETYEYDDFGNITSLNHTYKDGRWKRMYHYEYEDDPANLTNRLKSTSADGDSEGGPYSDAYTHDTHGNMLSMPHLSSLTWNFSDQLRSVDLGGGGTVWYMYGIGGNRTRKVIERQGGKRIERIYLGPVEIYREYLGDDLRLQRNTVHISDNAGRIAQVDTKLLDKDNSDTDNPLDTNLIRYQYGNHVGSAAIETDESGTVISYEEYHPFGTSAYRSSKSGTNLSLKRYRFSGKERDDETGMYYFGARYLAAWLGRWISSDPAGFVGGFNLFRYCSNNPVNYVDPNGLDEIPIRGAFLGRQASWTTIVDNVPTGYHIREGINEQNYSTHWTNRAGGYWDILERDTPATGGGGAQNNSASPNPTGGTDQVTPGNPAQPAPASPGGGPDIRPGDATAMRGGLPPPSPNPPLPPPKIDLPQAPPGTDFRAAESAGRANARATYAFNTGEQAQHYLKWRQGRNTNLDPTITNDVRYMRPLQSRNALSNGPYVTPGGRSFNNPHTFADRGLYPEHEVQVRSRWGGVVTERVVQVETGRRVMNDMEGTRGPMPPYIVGPTLMGVGGNIALQATRVGVPFVAELEIALVGGGQTAIYYAGHTAAGALIGDAMITTAAYVPVVGGSAAAGAIAGHAVDSWVTQETGSEGWGTAAGVVAAAGTGAAVGALIGSVVPVAGTAIGAGIGAAIGAASGLAAYLITKFW